MRVKFYVPSYKRPQKSSTQKLYPYAKLVVRESDAKEYMANKNDIVIVPDSAQGNVCRIKNYILDNFLDKDDDVDAIVIIDDDCTGLYKWDGIKKIKLNPTELKEIVENMTGVCDEWGFKLWGMSPVSDKQSNREGVPFNTLLFVGSPFHCHLKGTEIRYDEDLPLKEDYDITLQHINKYDGCLRVNFLCYDVKQGMSGSGQIGGCATYRNMDREIEQFKLLQKKWGSDVIREDKTSKRSMDTNPIMRTGLRGI
jgi:hypothetical protein